MTRLIFVLLGIIVVFSGATLVLLRFSLKIKSVKYAPALLCLIFGLYYLYSAKTVPIGSGFENLANLLLAIMFLTGFASGLATGLIIDFSKRFKS